MRDARSRIMVFFVWICRGRRARRQGGGGGAERETRRERAGRAPRKCSADVREILWVTSENSRRMLAPIKTESNTGGMGGGWAAGLVDLWGVLDVLCSASVVQSGECLFDVARCR